MSHTALQRRHLSCQPAPGRPLQTLTCDSVRLQGRRATTINSTERACEKHPGDPDADLRKWLRDYAKSNQRKGFRRAWADLRAAG